MTPKTGEYSITDKTSIIDILDVEEIACKSIFNNSQWIHWVNALNHAVYSMKCDQMGITKKSKKLKSYKISAVANTLNLESVTSKIGATKAIQSVLDAILFVPVIDKKGNEVNSFKVDGRDVTALLDNYTKWSSKEINTVVFPTEQTFRTMLMRVFHRVITSGEYSAE